MRRVGMAGVVGFVLLSACSSFGVRTEPRPPGVPGAPEPDVVGSDPRPMEVERPEVRTACRAAARPRGWIAVGYLRLGSQCPEVKEGDGYNGVRLHHYGGMAPGAVLVVCADQPTPRGWVRKNAAPELECAGARVGEREPTTKTIQRVR